MYCIDRIDERINISTRHTYGKNLLSGLYSRTTDSINKNKPFYFILNVKRYVKEEKIGKISVIPTVFKYFHEYALYEFLADIEQNLLLKCDVFKNDQQPPTIDDIKNVYEIIELNKTNTSNCKYYLASLYFKKFIEHTTTIPINEECSLYFYRDMEDGKKLKITLKLKKMLFFLSSDVNMMNYKNLNIFRKDCLIDLFKEFYPFLYGYDKNIKNALYSRCIIECSTEYVNECIINILRPIISRRPKTATQIKKEKNDKKQKQKINQHMAVNDTVNSETGNESDDTTNDEIKSESNDTVNSETGNESDETANSKESNKGNESDGITDDVKTNLYPFTFSFNYKRSFYSKTAVMNMLYDLYDRNPTFQKLMTTQYDRICVIQDLHHDKTLRDDRTLHITIFLSNIRTNEKSDTLHAYINNNSITALTRIQNII